MKRQITREYLLGMALIAIVVVSVSLYQMDGGSLAEKLAAALGITVACWAMSVGTIRLLAARAVVGIVALLAGLLVLYSVDAAGLFEQVGF
jgi:hypothetical protein